MKTQDKETQRILLIEESLLSKISYLCTKVSTKEWSGPLFFKIEGDILSEDNITVTASDLYLMDIGSGVTTEYNYADKDDERLVDLYTKKPELMDYRMGSVHSHAGMQSFFSGTDITELEDGAKISDMYLMLVVNNKNYTEWVAKIGIAAKVKKKINAVYTFYTGRVVNNKQTVEEDTFFQYDLDIVVKNSYPEAISEVDEQLKAVEELAKKKIPKYPVQREIWDNSYGDWQAGWGNRYKRTSDTKEDGITLTYIDARNLLNITEGYYMSFKETVEAGLEETFKLTGLSDDELFDMYLQEIEDNIFDTASDVNESTVLEYFEALLKHLKPYVSTSTALVSLKGRIEERIIELNTEVAWQKEF